MLFHVYFITITSNFLILFSLYKKLKFMNPEKFSEPEIEFSEISIQFDELFQESRNCEWSFVHCFLIDAVKVATEEPRSRYENVVSVMNGELAKTTYIGLAFQKFAKGVKDIEGCMAQSSQS